MRLWHKSLIPYLPRQQLIGQWRECCLIAKNISKKGTPNHVLVNRIMDYPISHFWEYGYLLFGEMSERSYKGDFDKFEQWFVKPWSFVVPCYSAIFEDWHNDRYLRQCLYNLQEKFDCGAISHEEWNRIVKGYGGIL